jgi:hypothetical protein
MWLLLQEQISELTSLGSWRAGPPAQRLCQNLLSTTSGMIAGRGRLPLLLLAGVHQPPPSSSSCQQQQQQQQRHSRVPASLMLLVSAVQEGVTRVQQGALQVWQPQPLLLLLWAASLLLLLLLPAKRLLLVPLLLLLLLLLPLPSHLMAPMAVGLLWVPWNHPHQPLLLWVWKWLLMWREVEVFLGVVPLQLTQL